MEHVRIVMRELHISTSHYSVNFTNNKDDVYIRKWRQVSGIDYDYFYEVHIPAVVLLHGDLSAQIRAAYCALLLTQGDGTGHA